MIQEVGSSNGVRIQEVRDLRSVQEMSNRWTIAKIKSFIQNIFHLICDPNTTWKGVKYDAMVQMSYEVHDSKDPEIQGFLDDLEVVSTYLRSNAGKKNYWDKVVDFYSSEHQVSNLGEGLNSLTMVTIKIEDKLSNEDVRERAVLFAKNNPNLEALRLSSYQQGTMDFDYMKKYEIFLETITSNGCAPKHIEFDSSSVAGLTDRILVKVSYHQQLKHGSNCSFNPGAEGQINMRLTLGRGPYKKGEFYKGYIVDLIKAARLMAIFDLTERGVQLSETNTVDYKSGNILDELVKNAKGSNEESPFDNRPINTIN